MPHSKVKTESYALLGGINTKVSPYAQGETEFLDLVNFDFTKPGALSKRHGSSLFIGATVSGRITGLYEFSRLSGSSKIIVTANTNAYYIDGNNLTSFKSGLKDGALFDFTTFVDRLFAANGQDFFKYDLSNSTNFSLPEGATVGFTGTLSGAPSSFTGIFVYSYGYLNDRGYLGPCSGGITISVSGASWSQVILTGFTTWSGYGTTSIAIYRTGANSLDQFRIGFTTGATFVDTNLALGTATCPDYLFFTLVPRYMEIYNNQLFMAGFSSILSTTYFSDLGEPEGVFPEAFFETRTNDGDRVTGLKAYNGNLVVTKENSVHILLGDNPDNFLLREISTQYGCLSNRAIVTWEDQVWFLDKKGVCEYNGANIRIVSDKIEPIFQSMNIAAARDNATANHVKFRNELWFSIPCNGATINNCTVVYDYLSKAWTKFEGFQPSSLSYLSGGFLTETVFYGGYSGSVHSFGSSLFGDNGAGITLIAKTQYNHNMGQSIEKQYRRLFANVDLISGQTLTINLRADYSDTISATRYIPLNQFQTRIDFGIPAKTLSTEFTNFSSSPIRIYGYTVEMRFQRAV